MKAYLYETKSCINSRFNRKVGLFDLESCAVFFPVILNFFFSYLLMTYPQCMKSRRLQRFVLAKMERSLVSP